jgi:AbiV family abortive infection protein
MKPKDEALSKSICETTANGRRLFEDAKTLFDWDRFPTALALAVLAQEEFAKAFLLQLVLDDALPWLPAVQRSIARHQCKHLLGLVMEWLPPFDWDRLSEQNKQSEQKHQEMMAWLKRRLERYQQGNFAPDPDDPEPVEPDFAFPPEVATALNIYRHEEIERLAAKSPWKDDEWVSGVARKIADGALDQKKQSALYVSITKTGEVGLHPGSITREEAAEEIEKAGRLSEGPVTFSDEYRVLKQALPKIFANMAEDGIV